MIHHRMGLPFQKRMATTIVRRETCDLETARRDFHSMHAGSVWEEHGCLLAHHWNRFEDAFREGDVIRRFTSFPSGECRSVHAKRGFICERSGQIVEGIVTEVGYDPVRDLEDRAFLALAATTKELEQEILDTPLYEPYGGTWQEFMQ